MGIIYSMEPKYKEEFHYGQNILHIKSLVVQSVETQNYFHPYPNWLPFTYNIF